MESKRSTSASSGRTALIESAMEVLPGPEATRKDQESYLDHRMQPDLGVANLSRLSQAPNAAIKKRRLCIRVIGFTRSLWAVLTCAMSGLLVIRSSRARMHSPSK